MPPHSASPRASSQPVIDKPNLFVRQVVTSDLTLAAKAVLLTIAHYAWFGTRVCYASNRTIARDIGISDRHVQRVILDLEGRGLIRTERATGSKHSRRDIYLGPCIHQVGQDVQLRLHDVGHSADPGWTSGLHEVRHRVAQELGGRAEKERPLPLLEWEGLDPDARRLFARFLPPS